MSKLLFVNSSPRKERSHSNAVAEAIVEAHRQAHPGGTVDEIDLWSEDLMAFDGDALDAKYSVLHGESPTPAQAEAWKGVEAAFRRFAAAETFLFTVPMWNFTIPYRLKHYIDLITQPGLAFSFSPDTGFQGLVTGKPAIVVYASGSAYPAGSEMAAIDFQKPYFEHWLRFIGFSDIRPVVIEPTMGAPDDVAKTIDAAREKGRAALASG